MFHIQNIIQRNMKGLLVYPCTHLQFLTSPTKDELMTPHWCVIMKIILSFRQVSNSRNPSSMTASYICNFPKSSICYISAVLFLLYGQQMFQPVSKHQTGALLFACNQTCFVSFLCRCISRASALSCPVSGCISSFFFF